MSQVDALVLDLLEWLGDRGRPYSETLDAWRTSCPRLPVWEDANDCGFVERRPSPTGLVVAVSDAGAAHLRSRRPAPEGTPEVTRAASPTTA